MLCVDFCDQILLNVELKKKKKYYAMKMKKVACFFKKFYHGKIKNFHLLF